MKIQTKFDIGMMVMTPLNERAGKIIKISFYGAYYFKYEVAIEVPMLNESKFKTYCIEFQEEDLVRK